MTEIRGGATSFLIQKKFWKRLGHFLKWRIPVVILVFLILRILTNALVNLRTPAVNLLNIHNEGNPVETEIQSIELRIEPPDGTYIEAACYHQNDEGIDTNLEIQNFTKSGILKFSAYNDGGVYYCDALHGKIASSPNLSTKDFSVYGDLVPEESSVWLVDYSGRRRIERNGIKTQDSIGRWHPYPQYLYD